MTSYINDVLDRLVALEIEALASIGVAITAEPFFFYTPEVFPYFTNRLADAPIGDDGSEVEDVQTDVFIARMVVGHNTSGFSGEREREMYEWLPVVAKYINEREQLQSQTYPARPMNLYRARCFNAGGFRIFDNAGIGSQQYGAELQIRIDRYESITQVYL